MADLQCLGFSGGPGCGARCAQSVVRWLNQGGKVVESDGELLHDRQELERDGEMGPGMEWEGLTESEPRAKLEAKPPDRTPDEKRTQISDKLVAKTGGRGILAADDAAPDEAAVAALN